MQAHRKALPYSEAGAFLTALRGPGALPQTRWAIEFLILTAARSLEVREATWEEIDLDTEMWTIPATRMKMKRAHGVPLSPRAVEILREAHDLFGGTGFLFPGAKAGRPLSDVALSKTVKGLAFRWMFTAFARLFAPGRKIKRKPRERWQRRVWRI